MERRRPHGDRWLGRDHVQADRHVPAPRLGLQTDWFRFTFPLVPKKYVDLSGTLLAQPAQRHLDDAHLPEMLQLAAVTSDIQRLPQPGDEDNKMGIDYAAIDRAYTEVGQPDLWSDFRKDAACYRRQPDRAGPSSPRRSRS